LLNQGRDLSGLFKAHFDRRKLRAICIDQNASCLAFGSRLCHQNSRSHAGSLPVTPHSYQSPQLRKSQLRKLSRFSDCFSRAPDKPAEKRKKQNELESSAQTGGHRDRGRLHLQHVFGSPDSGTTHGLKSLGVI